MHKPVLLNEVINFLSIKDRVYVDCTLGCGGHSEEILKALNGKGMLIGIEKDKDALNIAKEKLKGFTNCHLFHSDFLELKDILRSINIDKITGGILLDLGVNSIQVDNPLRGFSFRTDAPLDMRMDTRQALTAYNVVNNYKEDELSTIIFKYGEERYARKIAKIIVQNRANGNSIKMTKELANLILKSYPKEKRFKIHPATRAFQAIRIEVNKELENLENFLRFTPELLSSKGRLTVISFHSLEDRITKHFLKSNKEFNILTKKPVIPTQGEIEQNPRARSAKLRVAERI